MEVVLRDGEGWPAEGQHAVFSDVYLKILHIFSTKFPTSNLVPLHKFFNLLSLPDYWVYVDRCCRCKLPHKTLMVKILTLGFHMGEDAHRGRMLFS